MTGPRALQRLLLALALALGMCAGCEVVAQLPVITSFPPSWDVTTTPKTLEARITQNNGPLARSLRVRCEFSFERPPTQLPNVRSVPAQRMPGTRYFCIIRPGSQLRNNHVLRFEWFVESLNSLGQAIPVARSGVQTFHVGCENPTQFLQNDQAAVLASFGAVTTRTRILLAGYIPAHPVAVPMPIPLGGEIDRVFRGMGVAFARAQDVLAAGNFAPSGLPQSGQPNLLLFLPSQTIDGRPDLADPGATYRLIGWAYAVNLTTVPGPFPPNVGCFPLHEWFFHEAGVHTLDGGFSPGLGSALGVPHARLWDLHVWARESGVPALGILNVTGAGGATTPPAGFEAPANSFFHVPIPLP